MQSAYNAAQNFTYEGYILTIEPLGLGHINKTYLVATTKSKYTLQRINTNIFTNTDVLIANIEHVTKHLARKIDERGGDPERETLTLIKTIIGPYLYKDKQDYIWRSYKYIDNVITYQEADNAQMVTDAGYAFGDFINLLSDFEMSKLSETIENFHHTKIRYNDFEDAVQKDIAGRASSVSKEISFLRDRSSEMSVIVDKIESGEIPLRVTHNDTKLNNLLFDEKTNKPICILDLDTVMPGSVLYDFGDALRIIGSSAKEDEPDLNKVNFKVENFVQFTKGFISAAGDSLNEHEIDLLAFSVKLITMEIGMRFLTDYLNNDIYFAVHRDNHNLDRARTQFKLVADIETVMHELNDIVRKIVEENNENRV